MGLSKSANGRAMGCLILDSAKMLGNVVSAFVFVALMVCFQSPPGCAQEEGIESEPGQSSRSVVELVSFIKATETPEVRREALKKLEKTGPRNRAEFDMLMKAAKDKSDPGLFEASMFALRVMQPGAEDLRPEYRKLLKNRNPWLKSAGCSYLGNVKDKESVHKLVDLLEDKNCSLAASRALGKIGDRSAIREMIKRAGKHPDALAGIRGFGPDGVKAVIEAAERIPEDKGDHLFAFSSKGEQRKELLEGVVVFAGEESKEYLLSQKYHPDKGIRGAVLRALAKMRDPSLAEEFARNLDDPSRDIWSPAVNGLVKLQTPEAMAVLEQALLKHSNPSVKSAICASLSYYGWESNISALEIAAENDKYESVRKGAKETIESIQAGRNSGSWHHPKQKSIREQMERMKERGYGK